MGADSTLNITREDALQLGIKKLLEADDTQLERVLHDLVDNNLYYFNIVSEYSYTEADDIYLYEYRPGRF